MSTRLHLVVLLICVPLMALALFVTGVALIVASNRGHHLRFGQLDLDPDPLWWGWDDDDFAPVIEGDMLVENEAVLARELDGFCRASRRDFLAGNRLAVLGHFDLDRLHEELCRQLEQPKSGRERRLFVSGFRQEFQRGLDEGLEPFDWDALHIKHIARLPWSGEALVYVRLRMPQGHSMRMRFWLLKRQGTWRLYDFQDLEAGLRLSTLSGRIANNGLGRTVVQVPPWHASLPVLLAARRNLQAKNIDRAEDDLERLANVRFPPDIEAVRLAMLGSIKVSDFDIKGGLADLDRAAALHADLPILHLHYSTAFNNGRRHQEALAALQKFTDLLGHDADTRYEEGRALAGLGRKLEAVDAFRKSLDDGVDYLGSLNELRRLLPADKKGELGERFAKVTRPREFFDRVCGDAVAERDSAALQAYLDAMAKIDANFPSLHYHRFRLRIQEGRLDEGIELFKVALDKVNVFDRELRRRWLTDFLLDMVDAGQPIKGYQAAPDAKDAFAILAADLSDCRKLAELDQLIAAHSAKHAGDVQLVLYHGVLLLARKEHAKAEAIFTQLLDRNPDEQLKQRARNLLVTAMAHNGKVAQAYHKFAPGRQTFDVLALQLMSGDQPKVRELRQLIAVHRKADPNDDQLSMWDIEVCYLDKDYDRAVELMEEHWAKIAGARRDDWKLLDRWVRCLVRLKRFDEARRVADQALNTNNDRLPWIIVAAVSGNVAQTEEHLKKYVQHPNNMSFLYGDPDIGPALGGDAFRQLRARFPEQAPLPALQEDKRPLK